MAVLPYYFRIIKYLYIILQIEANNMDGLSMTLITVTSETLKYISNYTLNKLSEQVGESLHIEKIRWILTVPDLCNEKYKFFIRKSAVKAGIINKEKSFNLLLCLESEGSSIKVNVWIKSFFYY